VAFRRVVSDIWVRGVVGRYVGIGRGMMYPGGKDLGIWVNGWLGGWKLCCCALRIMRKQECRTEAQYLICLSVYLSIYL